MTSHLLTTSDRAAMRHDSRASDADARLATIQKARDELAAALYAAAEKFVEVANDMREQGPSVTTADANELVEAMLENADDAVWKITDDLEDMANGAGRYMEG